METVWMGIVYSMSTQIVRVMGCFCTISAAAIVSALIKIGASLLEGELSLMEP